MIEASTVHLVAALGGAFALLILAGAVFLPQVTQVARSATNDASRSTLSSLAARIPISEIRDDLIARRAGSFCAGWACVGLSTPFADAERLEAVSTSLDAFIKGIRHPEIELQFRYVIDYETQQVLEKRNAQNNCVNSPAAWLEERCCSNDEVPPSHDPYLRSCLPRAIPDWHSGASCPGRWPRAPGSAVHHFDGSSFRGSG